MYRNYKLDNFPGQKLASLPNKVANFQTEANGNLLNNKANNILKTIFSIEQSRRFLIAYYFTFIAQNSTWQPPHDAINS
jgi:hypothetical protein